MKKMAGFTLVELMIVVATIGLLSVIAIPNFLKMQCKSKQAEAKMNLAGIYMAEIAYFSEQSTYAGGDNAFNTMGWEPESVYTTRYAYLIADDIYTPLKPPPSFPTVSCDVTQTSFTALAAGNIDNDLYIDVWSVNNSRIFDSPESDLARD